MSSDQSAPLVKISLPLQYQQDIFSEVRGQAELVILAQGLGLLRIITNLLHGYDAAGNSLVLVVGADDQENEWIGEALAEHHAVSRTPLARGLKVINTDNATVRMRQKLYSEGGVLSVTSRILIVDLLSKVLDPSTVTGVVIMHAEKVVATSLEAFIIRVYRQFNKDGFLKAFSDRPEPFTTGFAPLANSLRNLFLQRTSLWPRFQVTVAESLEGDKRAEVIELEVSMTEKMRDIQNAVLECVEVNVRELKRANSGLDVEDWTVDSALHKTFDIAIRRQLDPVWHRVSFRTRQIANDLTVLRSILHSLLTYDSVSLLKYLDTILAAHSAPAGSTRQNFSPWLFLDAAHILFQSAKSRVYRGKLDGRELSSSTGLPDKLEAVLEEQPKWQVLAEVLDEIERDLYHNPVAGGDSNAAILIMTGDQRTSRQIREYLQTMHVPVDDKNEQTSAPNDNDEDDADKAEESEPKPSAAFMMRRKLREYLKWKPHFRRANEHLSGNKPKKKEAATDVPGYSSLSSAGPGQQRGGRAPPNKRRRVRGSSSTASTPARTPNVTVQAETEDSSEVLHLLENMQQPGQEGEDAAGQANVVVDDLDDMEDYYELYDMNDLIITHSYAGDMDDHILEETRPRYIIMFEPDAAFIRRVEVYRSSHTNRNVRVYFMYYGESVEERRYLSAVRREKDAFTKLIKEKGTMAMALTHDKSAEDPQEQFLRTVNTRIAGGGRLAATAAPPTVVVDVREFRSALPSLLHGRSMVVLPCQITVGDYILSPDICVERKSVRDLISSLKSGRLYNQTETMLQHYKSPVLLIEFDQNQAFTFDAFTSSSSSSTSASASTSASTSSSTSFIPDNATALSTPSFASGNLINPSNPRSAQHLLVLLTLSFPRVKIIWSSSPYQTAEIFAELKKNNPEPDPVRSVQIGLDFDISSSAAAAAESSSGGGALGQATAAAIEHRTFNQLPQDMLSAVPGVNPQALERLVLETGNIHQVANMGVEELDPLVGREVARKIVGFFRRSVFEEDEEKS